MAAFKLTEENTLYNFALYECLYYACMCLDMYV